MISSVMSRTAAYKAPSKDSNSLLRCSSRRDDQDGAQLPGAPSCTSVLNVGRVHGCQELGIEARIPIEGNLKELSDLLQVRAELTRVADAPVDRVEHHANGCQVVHS